MLPPKEPVDWPSLWADLLQGIGAGLLHHDGSRLAQAALLGLDAFDAAQARRRSENVVLSADGRERNAEMLPWRDMSPAELAEFQRFSPEQRAAIAQEAAEIGLPADLPDNEDRPLRGHSEHGYDERDPRVMPQAVRRQPLSPNPFAGWPLEAIMPFRRDGRLNISPLRR